MKKTIIAALGLSMVAAAGYAKTADEMRVYINPGHGSWTPNDRPCTLVGHSDYQRVGTDTTNFFETNTNLRKGFGVLEKLRAYGLKFDPTLNQTGDRHQIGAARDLSNNIVMSHVKCGPYHDDNGTENQLGTATPADIYYYNRNLTEICQEVDANNFDMFISIHSNAASEGTATNYPLFLYRGYDSPKEEDGVTLEHQTVSRALTDACWGYAFENPHMQWTAYSATNKNLRGDINFYGSSSTSSVTGCKGYLGVLKHHVPGFLVEGYFHTYQVARHRAMNWDVDYMEGAAYAHGIADYFGLTKESTGDIYGIVRDANERFVDTYFKPNTATLDRFMPLNGCTVVLRKDGAEVARYVTDNQYNGAFVFKDVEPGDYTLTFESEDYLAGDPVPVVVKAAQISYPTAQLVNVNYEAPAETYENYPDPMRGNSSVLPATEYALDATFADEAIPALEGKLVKRVIARNGKLYILALDKEVEFAAVVPAEEQAKATIVVYNPEIKQVVAEVSTDGAEGSIAAISDIQVTADGYLLACNATKTQFDDAQIQEGDAGRGTFYIYKWANDEAGLPAGAPAQWIACTNSGLWFRAYPSHFAYSGTTEEGYALISMPTITAPGHTLRSTYIAVTDGEAQTPLDVKNSGTTLLGDAGSDFNLYISPLSDTEVLSIDSKTGAHSFGASAAFDDLSAGNAALADVDGRAGIFKYAGASFVVYPTFEGENATGLAMANITADLNGATSTALTFKAEVAPVATASAAAAAEVEAAYDEFTGAVTEGWINLYLLRDGKLTKFTTHNVAQPQPRRHMAYDVDLAESGDGYALSFKLTGDAANATVRVTPEEEGYDELVRELGALEQGEHTVTIAKEDLLADLHYTWSVDVESQPIAQAGVAFSDPSGLEVRGGVIPVTDSEYASYGYVAVGHGANKGIDIYNPLGEKVASRLFVDNTILGGVTTNQSNPIRGNQHNGYTVFATWGDTGYGIVAVNPLDTEEEPFTLFAGTKSSSGCFVYDGVNLGGGNSGFDFITDADGEEYVISFSEDHENLNGKGNTENSLVKQHMSDTWAITEAPEVIGYKAALANTNVDVLTYGNGVFVAQVRGAGNNMTSVPCFAYIKDILTAPDMVMTSADDNIVDYVDNNTSSVAITTDGSLLAAALTSSIVLFDVEWKDGVPALTYKYSFPVEKHTWSHLRFDGAGNLHAYLREGGYRVYSLPAARPVATTKGVGQLTGSSSVELTAAEAAQAAPVYYNLQGIRVNASDLTPGIYVKVCGEKSEKVVVR